MNNGDPQRIDTFKPEELMRAFYAILRKNGGVRISRKILQDEVPSNVMDLFEIGYHAKSDVFIIQVKEGPSKIVAPPNRFQLQT